MRQYILASHGTFAEGINSSVEIIIGKQNNVHTLCAYVDDNDLKTQVKEKINEISLEDELIVFTDVFGGSVNTEFMKHLTKRKFHLISGMHLALLIEVLMNKETDLSVIIPQIIEESKSAIRYCNKDINVSVEEEEF